MKNKALGLLQTARLSGFVKASVVALPIVGLGTIFPRISRLLVILLCGLLITPFAEAAVEWDTDAGGQLVGALGVEVGGMHYDVEFVEGTCAEVFGTCEIASFDFRTAAEALEASQALLDHVFLDLGTGQEFDWFPELTLGCSNPLLCGAFTPYAADSENFSVYRAMNWTDDLEYCEANYPWPGGCADEAAYGSFALSWDSNPDHPDDNAVWARWSAVPNLVLNGSFESGLDSWQLYEPTGTGPAENADRAIDGSWFMSFNWGDHSPVSWIEQTLDLTPGQTYRLGFYFGHYGGGAGDARLEVSVVGNKPLLIKTVHDTTPLTGGTPTPADIFNLVKFQFVADSSSVTLRFADLSTRNGISFDLYLDDVRVAPITPDATEQVVTIYFAGTNMTSAYWNSAEPSFPGPETVARLYHFHMFGAARPGHHAGFINGPSTFTPDWEGRFQQAVTILNEPAISNWNDMTLNLVGFSRGGTSTIHAAHKLRYDYPSLSSRIKKINILAFDPVPGESWANFGPDIDAETMNLPPDVEYHGFYANDERSYRFGPVFPVGIHTNFYKVPGSHETMVGNTRSNGHRDAGVYPGLEHMSHALWKIATELLGSSDWGHVRFEASDLHWYGGQTDLVYLESEFIDNSLALAWTAVPSSVYLDMRLSSFVATGNREAWWDDFWVGDGCHDGVSGGNISDDHARDGRRCVYYRPSGYSGGLGHTEDDYNTWIHGVPEASWLYSTSSGYPIWNWILANGSLDVDEDRVDYSDDNCPITANPDQADTDGDGLGDACNDAIDSDGDDWSDALDNCIYVANDEQNDADGDGHGDICDADFDQSCFTNFTDLSIMKAGFFTINPVLDLNSSGGPVNFADLAIMKSLFFDPPGPSAPGSLCNPETSR